ncbi:MAG: conjugal transfer protein TraL [Tatlockia sp.]|nr:conjugal transfer protein TraL [Tatlockia sp.]
MANVHLLLQGKGGIGKSFVAITLAQYITCKRQKPQCIDTDGVNLTFHGFRALNVEPVAILNGNEIHISRFESLIKQISLSGNEVIIDTGSNAFLPLSHHLIHNKIPMRLQGMGHTCIVHTIIAGGQALFDTVNGFTQLISQFKDNTQFVVWLNPYWGAVEQKGKTFEEMKAYKENKHRISALVYLPKLKEETFGYDLTQMLKERLTFDEAIANPSRFIITRQRLTMIRRQLYEQIDKAVVV